MNLHGVSPPPLWLPPSAINPERVITALLHSAGAVRGTGTVLSFKAFVLFILYYDKKNSTEPIIARLQTAFKTDITHH